MNNPLADIQTLVAVAASAVTVLGIIFGWFRKALAFLKAVLFRKGQPSPVAIPHSFLVVHPPISGNGFWWSIGTSGGEPAMQIGGDLQVSNKTNLKIAVAGVRLRKPKLRGYVMVRDPENAIYVGYAIAELSMQHAMFEFWATPPFKRASESFTADLSVIDQFGNDHWLRNAHFTFRR